MFHNNSIRNCSKKVKKWHISVSVLDPHQSNGLAYQMDRILFLFLQLLPNCFHSTINILNLRWRCYKIHIYKLREFWLNEIAKKKQISRLRNAQRWNRRILKKMSKLAKYIFLSYNFILSINKDKTSWHVLEIDIPNLANYTTL